VKTRALPRSLFRAHPHPSAGSAASTVRPSAGGPGASGLSVPTGPSSPTVSPGPSGGRPAGPTRSDPLNPRDSRRVATMLERTPNVCLLCGKPAVSRGIWVATPSASERMGAARGKLRVISYGLCRGCQALPDVQERVEELLFKEAAQAMASASPEMN
jgi:hypothetical protein